jgi:hypothetical protein
MEREGQKGHARWSGCRESRKGAEGKKGEKITAGIGKQKPEKIYPIDSRRNGFSIILQLTPPFGDNNTRYLCPRGCRGGHEVAGKTLKVGHLTGWQAGELSFRQDRLKK